MHVDVITTSPVSKARGRQLKRRLVIAQARAHRVLSRAQLAEQTGLSASTVTHLVRDLLEEGYFEEIGAGESRGGRPMSMLRYRPEAEQVVVVDVHEDRIEASVADWNGTIVEAAVLARGADALSTIVQLVGTLVQGRSVPVRAVSVAVPGVAAGSGGEISLAPALGDLQGQPLGELLGGRLGLPVVVDNDVNLMVVGEHVSGAAADVDDILLVHVGESGIGAALMIDGSVRQGATGRAGEIGFLPLAPGQLPERGVGAFEGAWAAAGIARRYEALGLGGSGEPLAELQRRAVPEAEHMLAELLDAWARAIVATICVIDPGLVLLGGLGTELDDRSLEALRARVDAYSPTRSEVRRAQLGVGALRLGAVRRAFHLADGVIAP